MESSIRVPCCRQSLHVTCLARSFTTRGQSCPFCHQSLSDFARSASFLASSLFHGCMIDVDAPPTNRGINSLSLPSGFPRPPDHTKFLCCQCVGPPPLFEPTGDRRMEWSPFQNPGSSEWIPQWMCLPCNRVVGLETRDHPQIFCSQCQVICPTLVVDCFSDTQWMWCPRCQRREEITSQDASRSVVPNYFLHGPLSKQSPISPPGNGSQSWLLCPLILLTLAAAERERDVPLYSTGSRSPLPDVQRDFWNSQTAQIIHLYSEVAVWMER